MPRKYRTTRPPHGRVKASTFLDDIDYSHVPDITVWEPEERWVKTGILDASGEPIEYFEPSLQQPIGFVHFADDEEDYETDE